MHSRVQIRGASPMRRVEAVASGSSTPLGTKGSKNAAPCTLEISYEAVNFLDIHIYQDKENNLQTSVYRKNTATNNLLHANSQHPSYLIKGIPTGQYLRVRRLCSTLGNFKIEVKKLYDRFKQRGYSHNCLKRAYKRALESDRNEDLKEVIGNCPQITYRQSKNLKDRLIQSHYKNPSTKFLGRLDTNEYIIKQFMNCTTTGVIYVMECACGKRYVGKTKREFRRCGRYNGVMKFTAVEHIKSTTRIGDIDNKLLQCEAEWIYWLNTKVPAGLNEGFTFSPFL
ncbi:hypothetical protein XELAEV_18041592mg [Xenopus laevis]|uniref:Helix-turn-helix domain-containing protein n=1 Tax=Xenopus laevis TaxID=8355 RepID=A0A974C2F6_XENLA|nr:hypothetical protein XELAEV_18041592mg [Xenopus laevis]